MTDVDAFRDAEYIADVSGISLNDAERVSPAGSPSGPDTSRIRKLQSSAKIAFIDRLLRDLDILIYCELSALYYMDCSLILFVVRAAVELIFFTPKASPFDPTRNQPFVGAIFASNLLCMIFHAFVTHPEAGEATRGYLHGGLFIDFIGQRPAPLLWLLSFDVLILLVDFVMLALVIERVKMTASTSGTTSSATENTNTSTDPNPSRPEDRQDHDAEERGVIRGDEEVESSSAPGSTLNASPGLNIDEDVHDERTTLLADPDAGSASRGGHPLDSFVSGQAVIMDMGFWHTIRDQWRHSSTPRRPAGYTPSPEAAAFLRQRLGLQVGTNGRLVRVNR
ncbi:hypothetical protein N7492_006567 [Penicillium capsulatum]|uniref:DUF1746 domain-containing protein n=1 Tax=Penicillium capsulatum TaxID=69766 RepID=A0A9W9I1L0_9EURO|nr:hypothetical protein N7492_006567 [Penicillium capsulatum]KAJ6116403.1 hypothetical protein N7512_006128 [Penicillium capsulatum]